MESLRRGDASTRVDEPEDPRSASGARFDSAQRVDDHDSRSAVLDHAVDALPKRGGCLKIGDGRSRHGDRAKGLGGDEEGQKRRVLPTQRTTRSPGSTPLLRGRLLRREPPRRARRTSGASPGVPRRRKPTWWNATRPGAAANSLRESRREKSAEDQEGTRRCASRSRGPNGRSAVLSLSARIALVKRPAPAAYSSNDGHAFGGNESTKRRRATQRFPASRQCEIATETRVLEWKVDDIARRPRRRKSREGRTVRAAPARQGPQSDASNARITDRVRPRRRRTPRQGRRASSADRAGGIRSVDEWTQVSAPRARTQSPGRRVKPNVRRLAARSLASPPARR